MSQRKNFGYNLNQGSIPDQILKHILYVTKNI